MIRSEIFLLIPLVFSLSVNGSCVHEQEITCTFNNMTNEGGSYSWPEWCEIFKGDLYLNVIDVENADFFNLRRIEGSLIVVNTRYVRMPAMPNLVSIVSKGIRPSVVIMNNKELRDMRPFVNWDKNVIISGNGAFPVFLSGNTQLDTINLPKQFHRPYSPLSCEKRLTPNYSIEFAEAVSLASVIIALLLSATIFLYPLSVGNANVYFVPGYHKS